MWHEIKSKNLNYKNKYYKCTNCDCVVTEITPYCPYCGKLNDEIYYTKNRACELTTPELGLPLWRSKDQAGNDYIVSELNIAFQIIDKSYLELREKINEIIARLNSKNG